MKTTTLLTNKIIAWLLFLVGSLSIFGVLVLAIAYWGDLKTTPRESPKVALQQPKPQVKTERIETAELIPVDQIKADEQPTPPATKYESVDAYFKDAYPNPLSHRFNKPRYERDVSTSRKKKIIERDGGCCLVCGSTYKLEVDHRIALMNNGDNSDENLGTLCDSCHTIKTRLDWKVKKQRRKRGEYH